MKTQERRPILHYIQTARTASRGPVKIDLILEERIKAFRRAKLLHQAAKTSK